LRSAADRGRQLQKGKLRESLRKLQTLAETERLGKVGEAGAFTSRAERPCAESGGRKSRVDV
jgi:hypothetical protein